MSRPKFFWDWMKAHPFRKAVSTFLGFIPLYLFLKVYKEPEDFNFKDEIFMAILGGLLCALFIYFMERKNKRNPK